MVGCSEQNQIVVIDGNEIANVEKVDEFYLKIQNNELAILTIENRNGKEGQKSISLYKFDGTNISYEVIEPEENEGFVTLCEKIEKENENNDTMYRLTECSNTALKKDTLSIIKIPK